MSVHGSTSNRCIASHTGTGFFLFTRGIGIDGFKHGFQVILAAAFVSIIVMILGDALLMEATDGKDFYFLTMRLIRLTFFHPDFLLICLLPPQ